MNKEELQEKVNKSFEKVLDKIINNPDEFFDNDKLQEKYNDVLKENLKLKTRIKELEDGFKATQEDLTEYAEQLEEERKMRLDAIDYIKYLVIFEPNLGAFRKTKWGQELLEILGEDND